MNRNINKIHYDTNWEQSDQWLHLTLNAAPAGYVISSVSQSQQEQFSQVINRLGEFRKLGDNWDGYNSANVSQVAVDDALALVRSQLSLGGKLNLPEVFPTSHGTVALEWQQGEGEAVVEVGAAGVSGFVKAQPSSPTYYINGVDTQVTAQLPFLIASLISPQGPWVGSSLNVHYDVDKSDV
jgi:hypothetical protein